MDKDRPSSLTGTQRVAILMLALGEENAGRLLAMLEDTEIKEISAAMATLGPIRAELIEDVCIDFADRMSSARNLMGTVDNTERLLLSAMSRERVNQIMEEIRGPAGRTMWDKLGNVNETALANYLKNEYPQTVAVVLSKLRSDHSARVLALLPESLSLEVVMRMLRMEAVQKEVLDSVERTLRAEFMTNIARSTRRDAHEMMAEIFNNLDRNTEARMIAALEERNREAAERIKSLMFTFDDLQRLSAQAIQAVLRSIPKEKMPLALKGASEQLRSLFFSNMSERAGKMLLEEMGALGPVKLRDVDEAQTVIVTVAKEMAARGEITISKGASETDEEVVV